MNVSFWNLPIYHDDWRDNLTIELAGEETFYLDKQIQKGAKGTLLEYIFREFADTSKLKDLFIDLSPFSKEKEG